MASGSEDYWSTTGRLLAGLIEAIKTSVLSGGDLINAIEGIELGDGFLTLDQLNSEQCLMLARLTGINGNLADGGDVLNALDVLDGTVDGKLDATELSAVQADLLTQLTGINTNLTTGADLLNALDALDSTVDGKLDVTQLTAVQADLLAKLTGIDTSLLSGGDLLNALDALDGTMDGKLTLAELNTSSVKTNLDTVITRLNTTITNLASTVTKLTAMLESDLTREEYQKAVYPEGWIVVGDSEELIGLYDVNRRFCRAHADPNNSYNLDIVEREEDEEYITHHVLEPDDVWEANYLEHKLYAKCLGSGQTVGFLWVDY